MKNIILIIILGIVLTPKLVLSKDTSKSSIVIDLNSGRILYEKNSNEKRLIASTTKIMTAILTIENGRLSDEVEVGEEILKMYGTNLYLELGEKITIEDLLYGLILRSGNDSSVVLAKYIGGSEDNFVKLMNLKAQEIGMTNTIFSNPHGLDDETENYSTAADMALLSKYAYENKIYKKISSTKIYKTKTKNKTYVWNNRNKLLSTYEHCTGGKNGYTPKAGRTLVTTAQKDKLDLSVITLNDNNEYETHKNLYTKIYKEYSNYTIVDKDRFTIPKEMLENKKAYIKNSFVYPLTNSERNLIKTKINIYKEKVMNSELIGEVVIYLDKKKIGKLNIYSIQKEKGEQSLLTKIKYYFLEILKKLKLGLQNNLKPGPLVPNPLDTYNLESSNL